LQFPKQWFPASLANSSQNCNDSVFKSDLNDLGRQVERPDMQDLARYRAMESLCRQSAVFHPLESWRLLAEAEMWHHKAEVEIACRSPERDGIAPTNALARAESPGDTGRPLAS
jgi:hypothetical protein